MPLDRAELREIPPLEVVPQSVSPRKQRRVFVITAVVAAVIIALFWLYRMSSTQQLQAMLAAPRPATPIEVAIAVSESMPQSLTGIGTLQAVHQVTVAPEVGGRIVQIHFEPGAVVKAGDPLVQLNDGPERGDLANYQAQAHLASVNLSRDKALSSRQFQSLQVVDQQQSLFDQAQGNITKTEALIAQKLIRAPFSGKLGVRQVEVGGYVLPGGPIVTLTDLSTLWVNFTLPEQVSNKIHEGQMVRIKVDAFPDRIFNAKVTAIEPQISAQTRTLLVQATLSNDDHALLPGMFANAMVVLPEVPNVVTVPETAVDYSLYGDAVYAVYQDGTDKDGKPLLKVKHVFVTIGDHFDGKVAVVSGLKVGDRVAASGQVNLTNDAAVTILSGNSLATPPSAKRY